VLAAAALKCLGGGFMGRLKPRSPEEAERAKGMGFGDLDRVLTSEDLCSGESIVFVATGITDGDLVRGVRFMGNQARTHSILIEGTTGTVRFIESVHRLGAKPHRRL
jgi:fructose-1,6-bisphosphatase II